MTKRLARMLLYFGAFALALGASASAANFTPGSPGLGTRCSRTPGTAATTFSTMV